MVYSGWASMGGNEVLNNERIRALGMTYSCPMAWIKGESCDTLEDALSALAVTSGNPAPKSYDYQNIDDQPWYDPTMPESGRFFGAYGVFQKGLPDSTATASVTQGLTSGGIIGPERDTVRQVRYQAVLIGQGADALDYGMAWLDSALRPGACGQHSTECGLTDWEYFVDCPPARGQVTELGDWTVERHNFALDPQATSTTGTYTFIGGSVSVVPGWDGFDTALEWSGAARFGVPVEYPASTEVTVRVMVRLELAATVSVWLRPSMASSTNQAAGPVLDLPAGESVVEFTVTSPPDAGANPGLVFQPAGTSMDFAVTGILVTEATDEPTYFDGSTVAADPSANRYSWAGAEGDSISIMEFRQVSVRPQTDEEYAVDLNPYRRYLHDVARISGPFVVQEMEANGFDAYLVEFVIAAERPWVWSVTQDIAIPPSLPVIVQDVVYNLAPYPSAELSEGSVVVATNYSANPSLAANATGWTHGGSNGTIATYVTGGRVTGELYADVGDNASYRAVFAPTAGGTNQSFFVSQEVTIPTTVGIRFSISMWAAQVVMAGSPVRGDMEVRVFWRNGVSYLRTDLLGTIPLDGGSLSVESLDPPSSANIAEVQVRANVTSWSAGNIIRLYADAMAVTNP